MPRQNARIAITKDNIGFVDVPFAAGGGAVITGLSTIHVHSGVELGVALAPGFMHLNGREFAMAKGDAYFVDAMIPHWHYGKRGQSFSNAWVCMPFSALLGLVPGTSDVRPLLPFVGLRKGLSPAISSAPAISRDLLEVNRLFRERPRDWDIDGWQLLVGVVLGVYHRCRDQLDGIAGLPSAASYLALLPAVGRLDEGFRDPVTVEELAALCNLSPSRFAHLFAAIIGVPPVQYRNRLRISLAVEKLVTTAESLPAIASHCGFAHLSQFRDAFVKYTGTTPAAYRKQSPAT